MTFAEPAESHAERVLHEIVQDSSWTRHTVFKPPVAGESDAPVLEETEAAREPGRGGVALSDDSTIFDDLAPRAHGIGAHVAGSHQGMSSRGLRCSRERFRRFQRVSEWLFAHDVLSRGERFEGERQVLVVGKTVADHVATVDDIIGISRDILDAGQPADGIVVFRVPHVDHMRDDLDPQRGRNLVCGPQGSGVGFTPHEARAENSEGNDLTHEQNSQTLNETCSRGPGRSRSHTACKILLAKITAVLGRSALISLTLQ